MKDLNTIIDNLTRSMNDISTYFIRDYDLDNLERNEVSDLFWEYADNYCPVYTHKINEECTDEILDEYLSEIGECKITCSNDLDCIKMQALVIHYHNQLLTDADDIIKILYLKEIENDKENFEKYNFEQIDEAIDFCIEQESYNLDDVKDFLND